MTMQIGSPGALRPIEVFAGGRFRAPRGDLAIYTETAGGTRFGPYQTDIRYRVRLRDIVGAAPGTKFTGFRALFPNWYLDTTGASETSHATGVAQMRMSMSPSFPYSGLPVQSGFGGLDTVTLVADQTAEARIAMAAAPATYVEMRLHLAWDANARLYGSRVFKRAMGEQGRIGTTVPDQTYVVGPGYDPPNEGIGYAPVNLIGTILAPAGSNPNVAVVGDSIAAGAHDNDTGDGNGSLFGDANGLCGWADRLCGTKYGLLNLAMPGGKLANYVKSARRRHAAMGGVPCYVILALGVNDNPSSLAEMQAMAAASWRIERAAGNKPIQCTITGTASSTDGFATLAGQTVPAGRYAAGGLFQQFNDWVRTGAGGNPDLHGFLDVADSLMDRTTAKFRVDRGGVLVENIYAGGNALHPNTLGHTLIAQDLAASLAALVALPF